MADLLTPAETEALLLSLRVALVAVAASLPFAVATALLLARRRFPGKALVDALVHLPLVLPPVVMGYLLLLALGARAPLGAWLHETLGIRFVFSWTGAALAAAIVPGLLAAARTLGAGPLDRMATVVLPLALPGVLAGAITAFAASLGEFGAIITFVSNVPGETRTLPLAIYTALQTPGGETAAARLAALSIGLALAGLALSEWAARRLRARNGRRDG
jgi:molybdate transport system permease protein